MRYVIQVLQPGETVDYTTRLHGFIFWRAIVLLVVAIVLAGGAWYTADNQNLSLGLRIAAAVFAFLATVSGLRAFIRRATTELAITDRRVIYKSGVLLRRTDEMARTRVERVSVRQSLLGRLLGYGTITVHGSRSAFDPIPCVTDPLSFRSHLTTGQGASPQ